MLQLFFISNLIQDLKLKQLYGLKLAIVMLTQGQVFFCTILWNKLINLFLKMHIILINFMKSAKKTLLYVLLFVKIFDLMFIAIDRIWKYDKFKV